MNNVPEHDIVCTIGRGRMNCEIAKQKLWMAMRVDLRVRQRKVVGFLKSAGMSKHMHTMQLTTMQVMPLIMVAYAKLILCSFTKIQARGQIVLPIVMKMQGVYPQSLSPGAVDPASKFKYFMSNYGQLYTHYYPIILVFNKPK